MKLIKLLALICTLTTIYTISITSKKSEDKSKALSGSTDKTTVKNQDKMKAENTVQNTNKSENKNTKTEVSANANSKNNNTSKTENKAQQPFTPEFTDQLRAKINKYTDGKISSEAEVYKISNMTMPIPNSDSPPVPLATAKHLAIEDKIQLLANSPSADAISGIGDFKDHPPKAVKFEPVTYVKQLSPAGKASLELQESGDTEYMKILNSGFETPKTIAPVFENKPIRVDRAANFYSTDLENRANGDKIWSNVEFYRYGHQLMDVSRYQTPAKFERNMLGQVIVHAPSDSEMRITTPADRTLTGGYPSGFLSLNENEQFVGENELIGLDGQQAGFY